MGSSLPIRSFALAALAMCAVVAASNILVQHPVAIEIGALNLADLLTWGAFTYPVAFLVTDLTNRRFGPTMARLVVFVGFLLAVALSVVLATPRIAVASGSAFLMAQFLDVTIFNRLRNGAWWKAPLISSFIAAVLDTVLFFSLAFAPAFVMLGANDDFAIGQGPFLAVFGFETARWISWAVGDFCVKMLVALAMLLPYRKLLLVFGTQDQTAAA